ncbi:hypothetical protein J6590_081102 [Homalodisca vitripennis]|nr:hypothetical protein J6590_081102 [Homalodisca vitripennis]
MSKLTNSPILTSPATLHGTIAFKLNYDVKATGLTDANFACNAAWYYVEPHYPKVNVLDCVYTIMYDVKATELTDVDFACKTAWY